MIQPVPHQPRCAAARRLSPLSIALLVLPCALPAFAQFDPPPAYYDSAIGTTGANLKAALHNAIKAHTVLPYTFTATDTWDAIKILDEAPGDSASVVLIYSGLTNLKANQYAGGVGTGKWDREHLWPQSFGLVAISASKIGKAHV